MNKEIIIQVSKIIKKCRIILLEKILLCTIFKTISLDEFIEKNNQSIRNDLPIIDDDDLSFILYCFSNWSIDELSNIVLNYIDDYSHYE